MNTDYIHIGWDTGGSEVTSIKVGRRSSRLLACSQADGTINLYAVGHTRPLISLNQNDVATEISFDPTEQYLLTTSTDKRVNVWDLEQEQIARTFVSEGTAICATDFHPISLVAGILHDDSKLVLWDVRKKSLINTFSPTLTNRYATTTTRANKPSLQFTPDGQYALFSHGETIFVCNLLTGKIQQQLQCGGIVKNIAFHPTELNFAVGTRNGLIEVWSAESFTRLSVYAGPIIPPAAGEAPTQNSVNALTFSADGKFVMACFNDALRAITWENGTNLVAEVSSSYFSINSKVSWSRITGSSSTSNFVVSYGYQNSQCSTWITNLQGPKFNLYSEHSTQKQADNTPTDDLDEIQETVTKDDHTHPKPFKQDTPKHDNPSTSSESDALIDEIITDAHEMKGLFTTRVTSLRAVKAMWASKGTFSSLLGAIVRQPASVRPQLLADLLSIGVVDVSYVRTVDDASALIDLIVQSLLTSAVDAHVTLAISILRGMFKTYGTACTENFLNARRQIHSLLGRSGEVGQIARAAFKELQAH